MAPTFCTAFVLTLVMAFTSSSDAAGQLGRARDLAEAQSDPSLESAVEAYSEAVDWQPVAAVVAVNNDPKNPWIDAYTPMLAESIATELSAAGLDTVLPDDAAFAMLGNEQDAVMQQDGSLLNLAQFMQADCLAKVSLQRFTSRERSAAGVTRLDYVLQLSVRIIDPVRGATRGGDQVRITQSARAGDDAAYIFEEMMDEAVAEVAKALAASLEQTAADLRAIQSEDAPTIKAYADVVDMTLPDIRKLGDTWQMADSTVSVCPRFTLRVGGVALGTGPGVFDLSPVTPGLHMVEIASEGFEPYRAKMFIKDGMTLNVSLQMTPAFRSSWLERVAVFSQMRQGEQLTEAQVEVMQGYADWLRDSQYSIDIKYDHRASIVQNLQHQYDSGEVGDADTFDEVARERFATLGTELPDVNIGNSFDNSVTINDFSEEDRARFQSMYLGHMGF